MELKYIFAASRLRGDVALTANGLPLLAGDGTKFLLAIGQTTYLRITDGRNSEIVRYNGGPILMDIVPVTRAQLGSKAYVWSRGACVESILTEAMLVELVSRQCGACVDDAVCSLGCSLTNQVLSSNNTWTGTNSFRGPVSFGAATLTPADSICPVVTLNSPLAAEASTTAPCDVVGLASDIRRTAGTRATLGGQFMATAAIGVNGQVVGASTLADAEDDSAASLTGADVTVRNRENSNSSVKTGLRATFQNRVDPASVVLLGANRYNINSAALRVESQAPSLTGEFLGWERGLVFEAGSLARSLVNKAIGIDFADLTAADVTNTEAAIRLKGDLAIEMNGDTSPYDSKKFLYASGSRQFQLTDYANFRFGIDAKSAIMYLSDAGGAPGTLLAVAAGAASGKFLNIFCNGTRYKIQLLNP